MTTTRPDGTDCHIHVFGDPERYPAVAGRTYTPRPATLAQWRAVSEPLGITRAVLVQPSVYGTDNRRLLEGLREAGDAARGVAVIAEDARPGELEALHEAGVRGIRLNLATGVVPQPAEAGALVRRMAALVAPFGWHVQVLARGPTLEAVAALVPELAAPLVFDHMAGASAVAHPGDGDRAVLALLRAGRCWIKLSGADHVASRRDDPEQALPVMRRLVDANPERLVWGSDWPHVGKAGGPDAVEYLPLDHARLLSLVHDAAGEHAGAILSGNATRLYGWR